MIRISLAVLALAGLLAGQDSAQRIAWNKPAKPFRIIGNVYYVGAAGVSSFLIADPSGDVLIDGGLPETAPSIAKNIAALGFDIRRIKYLLNSHAHYDHCGGLAELKRRTGARLVASAGDAPTLTAGARFPAVKVDRIIPEGGIVELGAIRLTAHITPGHTKGCTTWTMPVQQDGKTLEVMFYCSTSVVDKLVGNRGYPNIASDYERTFARLGAMHADVFLGPHPGFFDIDEKRLKLEAGQSGAFVDGAELPRYVKRSERDFRLQLAREEKGR